MVSGPEGLEAGAMVRTFVNDTLKPWGEMSANCGQRNKSSVLKHTYNTEKTCRDCSGSNCT